MGRVSGGSPYRVGEENGDNGGGQSGGGWKDVDSLGELLVLSTQGPGGDGGLARPLPKLWGQGSLGPL